jgi:hypothetical protein
LVRETQILHPPWREALRQLAELRRQRLRRVTKVDEDVAVPRLAGDRSQGVIGSLEAVDLVHLRRGQQPAVESVGPRMIGTLDAALEGSAALHAQPRAAMTAHVVKRANRAVRAAHQQHARAGDLAARECAAARQLIGSTRGQPHPRKDALHLPREPRDIRVRVRRQRRANGARGCGAHPFFMIQPGFLPPTRRVPE